MSTWPKIKKKKKIEQLQASLYHMFWTGDDNFPIIFILFAGYMISPQYKNKFA